MTNGQTRGSTVVEDSRALGKRLLSQRIDALAAVSEQLELRMSGLQDEIQRLGDAQETLVDTASGLTDRVEELGSKGVAFEGTLRQITHIHQDLLTRLESIEAADLLDPETLEELRAGVAELLEEDARQKDQAGSLRDRLVQRA